VNKAESREMAEVMVSMRREVRLATLASVRLVVETIKTERLASHAWRLCCDEILSKLEALK
jgi:hypothetical protein